MDGGKQENRHQKKAQESPFNPAGDLMACTHTHTHILRDSAFFIAIRFLGLKDTER